MKKGISLAESVLTAVLNFLPGLCVQLGVLALFETQTVPWPAFLFALLPVCVLVTGRRTSKPAVFLGTAAAAAAASWLLSAGPVQKVVYIGALTVCVVTVIMKRVDLFQEGSLAPVNGGEKAGLPLVTYAVLLVCYLFVRGQGGTQGAPGYVLSVYQVLAAVTALLYFCYLFVSGFRSSMAADQGAAVRQKQVFLAGGFLNLAFLAAAAVLLFFSSQLAVPGRLVSGAGGLLYAFISWLVGLIPGSYQEGRPDAPAPQMAPGQAELGAGMPQWLEILLAFTARLVFAAVFLAAVWLLFRFLRYLWQAFGSRAAKTAGQEGALIRDETEDLRREGRKHKETALPMLARTPEQKIRKTYFRAMQEAGRRFGKDRDREKKTAFLEALRKDTVRELSVYFPGNAYERLAGLYEKARYGGAACRPEDAAAARQAARELRQEVK